VDICWWPWEKHRNPEDKVGISRHALDPETPTVHSVYCWDAEAPPETGGGWKRVAGLHSAKGRKTRRTGRSAGHVGRPVRRYRGTVGHQCGGAETERCALRRATVRCLLQGRPTRLGAGEPVRPGAWPRGAGSVSTDRLLGAASRPELDGRGSPPTSAGSVTKGGTGHGDGLHATRVVLVVAPFALELERAV
jgi:hypothetical protein